MSEGKIETFCRICGMTIDPGEGKIVIVTNGERKNLCMLCAAKMKIADIVEKFGADLDVTLTSE